MLAAAAVPPHVEPLDVVLCQDPYSRDVDDWKKVFADPRFCSVCCNLFGGTAYSLLPREDIQMHFSIARRENAKASKAKVHLGDTNDTDDVNYAAWRITARSEDMKVQAENNCSSCWILLNGITRLSNASPPQLKIDEDVDFEAEIIFCLGNVLMVSVYRTEEDTIGSLFGTERAPEEYIMICEFYTLPGKQFLATIS